MSPGKLNNREFRALRHSRASTICRNCAAIADRTRVMRRGESWRTMVTVGDRHGRKRPERALEEIEMAVQKESFHQASPSEAFLMNCWYVAAWDHELIDGRLLARTHPRPAGGALQGRQRQGGGARRPLLPPRRQALRRAGVEGDCVRCMYHGLKFDATRQVRADPGPGQHPAQARRAQLPGGRARPPGLDLDGRSGAGRSGEDPRLSVPARRRAGAAIPATCTTTPTTC